MQIILDQQVPFLERTLQGADAFFIHNQPLEWISVLQTFSFFYHPISHFIFNEKNWLVATLNLIIHYSHIHPCK